MILILLLHLDHISQRNRHALRLASNAVISAHAHRRLLHTHVQQNVFSKQRASLRLKPLLLSHIKIRRHEIRVGLRIEVGHDLHVRHIRNALNQTRQRVQIRVHRYFVLPRERRPHRAERLRVAAPHSLPLRLPVRRLDVLHQAHVHFVQIHHGVLRAAAVRERDRPEDVARLRRVHLDDRAQLATFASVQRDSAGLIDDAERSRDRKLHGEIGHRAVRAVDHGDLHDLRWKRGRERTISKSFMYTTLSQ